MKPRPISHAYCSRERKPCVRWVEKYFSDCLCNLKDEISFACGLVSLFSWGVAEIPQIITNFETKSGHGVSLAFLLTWIAGDVFNLLGCILEPATLPTQFYTALLYTTSTVVLVWQCVYYDHICRWWKSRKTEAKKTVGEDGKSQAAAPRPKSQESTISIPGGPQRASPSPQRESSYYTSARSLARSGTPPSYGSYLRVARSGPSAMQLNESSSSSDDEAFPVSSKKTVTTQPIRIPRSVGYGALAATSVNLPYQSMALMERYMGFSGIRQDVRVEDNAYGLALGWLMAAIYMGGRIPQIWLNIKRGSVEGLNPLMFIFALVANIAYVGSILARSTEWEKIRANMPWLLDAVVCVGLDLFIILQYIYYKYIQRKIASDGEDGDYKEAVKEPLLS